MMSQIIKFEITIIIGGFIITHTRGYRAVWSGKPSLVKSYALPSLIIKMKTEEEIKLKIIAMQTGKSFAKARNDDSSYKAWTKAERWLKWVVEEEVRKA